MSGSRGVAAVLTSLVLFGGVIAPAWGYGEIYHYSDNIIYSHNGIFGLGLSFTGGGQSRGSVMYGDLYTVAVGLKYDRPAVCSQPAYSSGWHYSPSALSSKDNTIRHMQEFTVMDNLCFGAPRTQTHYDIVKARRGALG